MSLLLSLRRRAWWRRLLFGERGDVTLNLGAGGSTCATDTIGGKDHQLVKVEFGAAGTATQASLTNPLPTRATGATGTCTNVASSAASTTVLAANAGRLRAWLYNDSTQPVNIKYAAAAAAGSFTKRMLPNEFFTVDGYTGIIDAIWDNANGNMRVTELTA